MKLVQLICFLTAAILLQGCATVFSGYYDTVELKNAPDSLRVYTSEGVEIPVQKKNVRVMGDKGTYKERPATQIELRSNLDPVLILKNGTQEKRIQAFGKIHAGWVIIDVLFIFPLVIDGITGNWNTYEPIDARLP